MIRSSAMLSPGRTVLFAACAIGLIAAVSAVQLQGERVSARPVPRAPDPVAPSAKAVDRAVKRGLQWLASNQSSSGCWTGATGHKRSDGYVVFYDQSWQEKHGRGHPGVTSLAGLAFLASGHLPGRGPYSETLDRTIDYVLDRTGHSAYMTDSGSRMYSHSFAVLFLSQVHGMTRRRSSEVESKLREACRFVIEAQNEYGAWRYTPGMLQADLSVTVCQVQALRAARNVGIRVPKACIDRVIDYVKRSRISHGRSAGAFFYKIYGRSARTKTSFTVNAAAATCLHSAGVFDRGLNGPALNYLEDHYDEVSAYYPGHYFYWYGNYYAVQALQMEGGKRWDRYWAKLSRDLVRRQRLDGSWENSVGPGDHFSTAMACLILRAPLGYLPVFRH